MTGVTTQEQILDAALEAMTTFGLARLSLADVAKRAGLSRQTLYRYFRTKTDLLDAVVAREEQRFLDQITAAADDAAGARDVVVAAIVATLDGVRRHPLINRLLETEPETLVPYLVGGAFPGPTTIVTLRGLLQEKVEGLSAHDAQLAAVVLCRL